MQSVREQHLVGHPVLSLGDRMRSKGVHDGDLLPFAVLRFDPDLVPLLDDGPEQLDVLLVASDRTVRLGDRIAAIRSVKIAHVSEPPVGLQRRWRDAEDTGGRVGLRYVV